MKKLKGKHLDILFALFLALTVQVFNTANLYAHISGLYDWEKVVACYFIGVSAEFAIFICIYNGSRSAGAWFALMTFFVGMMFHSWDLNALNISIPDFENSEYNIGKQFVAALLLQGINSLLVWFLSELYVDKTEENKSIHNKAQLQQIITDLQQMEAQHQQNIAGYEQELSKVITGLKTAKQELSEAMQTKEIVLQDIASLKKQKAGFSKGLTVENNG